jgi:tyrosine-protein kinase Etk/Wzc
MQSFAAEDNPHLILAKQELAALQAQLDRVAGSQHDSGSDINLSKGRVTESGMEYLNRFRDLKYAETVFELLAKEFEIAKLDEAREGAIIQVVDAATVPDKRSFPPRVLIVVLVTLIGLFVACGWCIVSEGFQQRMNQDPSVRRRVDLLRAMFR